MLDKNSESRVHVEAIEEPPPPGTSIAFGLERMGLIAVKAPILSCIVLAVLIVAAIFGINRIKIDDSEGGDGGCAMDSPVDMGGCGSADSGCSGGCC